MTSQLNRLVNAKVSQCLQADMKDAAPCIKTYYESISFGISLDINTFSGSYHFVVKQTYIHTYMSMYAHMLLINRNFVYYSSH